MVLLPSAKQVAGVVEIIGSTTDPVAALLLNDTLGEEAQLPVPAITV
jgi:hypothetical protein